MQIDEDYGANRHSHIFGLWKRQDDFNLSHPPTIIPSSLSILFTTYKRNECSLSASHSA